MASTYTATGTFSNLTRLQLEQLRKADFFAGSKALTVGDSALPPEGVVGPGDINAEPYLTGPNVLLDDVYTITPPSQPGPGITTLTQVGRTLIPGSATVTHNLNTFTLTSGINIAPGSIIVFSIQPGVPYVIASGSGGAFSLTTAYTGTSSTTTAILRGISESVNWYGPNLVTQGTDGSATASSTWHSPSQNFVGLVQAGDILLVKDNGSNANVVATVVSATSTDLTLTNITGGSLSVSTALTSYAIVRPTALQLFAVPGSGPTGSEQTFLAVLPGSALHNTVAPTINSINADRILNLVPPQYALNSTVDRADAVYDAPVSRTTLDLLGYRIILYPDNGSGTGPNLATPIAVLNPVIDPSIPSNDQRYTIDYKSGTFRFSCAPQLGGQIKVSGGVNATTGRLNLYAVFWAVDTSKTKGSARTLYGLESNNNVAGTASIIQYNPPTNSWYVGAGIAPLGSATPSVPLAGSDWAAMMAMTNWQPEVNWATPNFDSNGPSSGPYGIVWNDSTVGPSARQWAILAYYPYAQFATTSVFYTSGEGHTLNTLLPPGLLFMGPPSSFVFEAAGHLWISAFGGNAIQYARYSTAAVLTTNAVSASAITEVKVASFVSASGTSIIVSTVGSSTLGASQLVVLGFTGGITITLTPGGPGLFLTSWILKIGPGMAVAVPTLSGTGSPYFTNTNGSWVSGTFSTITGTIQDLTWNPTQSLWMISTLSGGVNRIYTSPDFVHWTITATLSSIGTIRALNSLRGIWSALYIDTTGSTHLIYSADAIHWYSTQINVRSVLTANNPFNPILAASDTMLAISPGVAPTLTNVNNNFRFSNAAAINDITLT